jgi:hypothetical protein
MIINEAGRLEMGIDDNRTEKPESLVFILSAIFSERAVRAGISSI